MKQVVPHNDERPPTADRRSPADDGLSTRNVDGRSPAPLASLHDDLSRRLDLDALRDLCLRLGVDYDDLPGDGKRAKLRGLVLLMERQGRSDELRVTNDERRMTSDERPHSSLVTRRSSLLLALCLVAAIWFYRQSRLWPEGPPLPPGVVGVAVAEFAETADCRRGPRGREASALVYAALERELAAAGLARRVALTRTGRVCDAAAAAAAGARAGAGVVIWGWRPDASGGLAAEFTTVAGAPVAADLAGSFEALVAGSDEPTYALSARAAVLARFLVGLVHAAGGDYAAAEALYTAALGAVTSDELRVTNEDEVASDELRVTSDASQNSSLVTRNSSLVTRHSLSVLLTERAKAHAAQGHAAAARADFDAAEALNPDYVRLLVARAADHYRRREWDAAQAYLDRAELQGEPLSAVAYGYGLLDYYRGRYAAAVAHFDRAIALSAADGADPAIYRLAREYAIRNWELGIRNGEKAANGGRPAAAGAQPPPDAQPTTAGSGQTTATASPAPELPLSPLAMAAAGVAAAQTTNDQPPTVAPTPPDSSLVTRHSSLPTPVPVVVIGTRGANVRFGPGPEYAVMATRRAGAEMEVLAANVSGEWYQVRVPGQGRGWVAAAYVALMGNYELGIRNEEWGGGTGTPAAVVGRLESPCGPSSVACPTPSPVYTPPGESATPTPTAPWPPAGYGTPPGYQSPTPARPTPTAPAPPGGHWPTRTPAPPPPPTATLLPAPTARGN